MCATITMDYDEFIDHLMTKKVNFNPK
jgi:hypothetical protein